MRNTMVILAAYVALAAMSYGCGESVPQRSARGGVLSGTEIERQRYAARRNPVLAGNGNDRVGQPSAAQPDVSPGTPRNSQGGAATGASGTPGGTGTPGGAAGTGTTGGTDTGGTGTGGEQP